MCSNESWFCLSDKAKKTSSESFTPQPSIPIYVHVKIKLSLIPATNRFMATFGSYALPSLPNEASTDQLSIALTTVNVEKIRLSIYRLKFILWDRWPLLSKCNWELQRCCLLPCSLVVPLCNRWSDMQSWKSWPNSAALLFIVWCVSRKCNTSNCDSFLYFQVGAVEFRMATTAALCSESTTGLTADWFL